MGQVLHNQKKKTESAVPHATQAAGHEVEKARDREAKEERRIRERTPGQKLTSPNAPLPMTLTVLKSLKPIFVRRSLKNWDCVRVCLLISRSWRSSGTPMSDLSSSAPLYNAVHDVHQRDRDRSSSSSSPSRRAKPSKVYHQRIRQSDRCRLLFRQTGWHRGGEEGGAVPDQSTHTHRMFKSIAVSSAKR